MSLTSGVEYACAVIVSHLYSCFRQTSNTVCDEVLLALSETAISKFQVIISPNVIYIIMSRSGG